MARRYTRQEFLGTVGVGAAGFAVLGLSGCGSDEGSRSDGDDGAVRASDQVARQGSTLTFRSRPDLRPPAMKVATSAGGTASGYVLAAAKNGIGEEHPSQDGAMILDDAGRPVWLRPVSAADHDIMDFRAQRYRGEPVLTWWEGVHAGWGQGEYVILDSSYREVARLRAGNGYDGDHHEFVITDRDTALIGIYSEVPMDLSYLGGPADGAVMEGIVQELDVETGEVLFEWHSLDHVGPEESYDELSPDLEDPLDYFHINSVEVDNDGNLLVSARRTSAVYKIDRQTGEVIWRLGGRRSDFEMGEGTRFAYQHDARRRSDGPVTIFDNRGEAMGEPSRGIVLALDETTMKATLLHEYVHPDEVFGIFQANVQTLPNDNVFIGWGSAPYISEFSPDGELLFDLRFPREVESYRAYRSPWEGRPADEGPAVATESGSDGEVVVYASWNGATEVTEWEVLAGPDAEQARPAGSSPRGGFETAITVQTEEPYLQVRAKDRSGRVLGSVEA